MSCLNCGIEDFSLMTPRKSEIRWYRVSIDKDQIAATSA